MQKKYSPLAESMPKRITPEEQKKFNNKFEIIPDRESSVKRSGDSEKVGITLITHVRLAGKKREIQIRPEKPKGL